MTMTHGVKSSSGDADEAAAVWVERSALKPWDRNPRKNAEAVQSVVNSIRRFGFGNPILARRADGEVIAGHTRLLAAEQLGLERVPVRFLDLDPADAHLLAVADNKLAEIAEWDDAALASIMSDYSAEDAALAGFEDDELSELAGLLVEPADGDDDAYIEPPANPVSRAGDVYELGQHRLLCGDCRSAADVALLLGGAKIDIAFTSPPYAAQRTYDKSSGFAPIRPDEYVAWFQNVQANVAEHIAATGSWFVNIKEHAEDGQRSLYVKDLTIAHVRQWGWHFVDEFCWRNTRNGVPGGWHGRFKNAWEPVFHFTRGGRIVHRPAAVSTESDKTFAYESGRRARTHSEPQ